LCGLVSKIETTTEQEAYFRNQTQGKPKHGFPRVRGAIKKLKKVFEDNCHECVTNATVGALSLLEWIDPQQ
jgi:hypothetical protein